MEDSFVEFSEEGRQEYDEIESDSQLYLNDFFNQKTIMINYPRVLSTITGPREFCDSGELCSKRYNRSSFPRANIQGANIQGNLHYLTNLVVI